MTHAKAGRIAARFAALKKQGRKGLVTFITAGDPDEAKSLAVLKSLPGAGADLIELGMPFSDPMADGPAIQEANIRALAAGMTLEKVLRMVASFRAEDTETPIILMGYFNPIYNYGTERFAAKAAECGVDGLIVVDVPPEEDEELNGPARKYGLDLIRLVTPTTDAARLEVILKNAGGFIYYVSITGVTGTASASLSRVEPHLAQIRSATKLPIAAGFGIRTPEDAASMGRIADAVVVGSVLVDSIGKGADVVPQIKLLRKSLDSLAP